MFTVESCLRNAAGCEREARSCDDPDVRILLMRIARDWRGLAAMEEAAAQTGQPNDEGSATMAESSVFWRMRIQALEIVQRNTPTLKPHVT